ncbi:hypothetical protein ABZ470_05165 [Streptosporangium sp. NPDC020072]|uniref:hypothetical protein n=1 Tax=unclassified Streptosporangium TaxID=2632669 RepID=UPI003424E9B5
MSPRLPPLPFARCVEVPAEPCVVACWAVFLRCAVVPVVEALADVLVEALVEVLARDLARGLAVEVVEVVEGLAAEDVAGDLVEAPVEVFAGVLARDLAGDLADALVAVVPVVGALAVEALVVEALVVEAFVAGDLAEVLAEVLVGFLAEVPAEDRCVVLGRVVVFAAEDVAVLFLAAGFRVADGLDFEAVRLRVVPPV